MKNKKELQLRMKELSKKPIPCDDCGSHEQVRQWRNTHYMLCEKCALVWLAF